MKGLRKGSLTSMKSVAMNEERKAGSASRTGSGRAAPPLVAGRKSWKRVPLDLSHMRKNHAGSFRMRARAMAQSRRRASAYGRPLGFVNGSGGRARVVVVDGG